jgi:DNA-binding CsgD family transcriptional regulator
VASFQAALGDRLLTAGRIDDAEPLLEEGVRMLQEEGEPSSDLYAAGIAAVALRHHDYDRAAQHLRASLDYHSRPPYRQPLGRAYRFIGIAELAFERGHPETAARLLGAAERVYVQVGEPERIAEVPGYPALSSRVESTLGADAAHALRREGARWSTPQTIDAAFAATWLEPVAAGQRPPRLVTASPDTDQFDGLTARERDILDHLAQGKTNEAIADALFISPRTVTTHVTRIYAKLGVTNRAEAVAFALAHGLTTPGAAA